MTTPTRYGIHNSMRHLRKVAIPTVLAILCVLAPLLCIVAAYAFLNHPQVEPDPIPIPVYPHARDYTQVVTDSSGWYDRYTITFTTNDGAEQVHAFYTAIIPLYRWIEDDNRNRDLYGQHFFQSDTHTASGNHFITITTGPTSDNQTRVTLSYFFQNS
jgi:hypothetical protein